MSQTGYTPIQLYRSSTAAAAPSAGSLADGELAINTTDEKLYFKNASGVVKVLASSAGAFGTVTSVDASGGTTGLTFTGGPITSSGTLTLGGTLAVANGGTGASSLTSGYLVKGNGTSAVTASVVYDDGTKVGIGTSSPSYKLDVTATGANIRAYTASGNAEIKAQTSAGGAAILDLETAVGLNRIAGGVGGTSNLSFYTASTERMRIDGSGNLLVGTTTANGRVSVVGDQISIAGSSGASNLGLQIKGTTLTAIPAAQVQGYIATGDSAMGVAGDLLIAPRTNAAANIRFITGTSPAERMRIDSGGNVGIGTSSPAATLDLGSTTGQKLLTYANGNTRYGLSIAPGEWRAFQASGAVMTFGSMSSSDGVTYTERVRIDSSGNVGIGTSSPTYKLDVSGTGQIGIRYTDTVATNSARLYLTCGTATGALQQYGSSHATYANALRLDSFAGPLQFATTNVERMRIDSSGNVGIGTTSPSYKLDIAGTLGVGDHITLTRAGGQFITKNVSTSYVLYSGGTSLVGAAIIMGGGTDATFGGDMLFRAGTTSSPERMRITSSGNVGIGNTPSGTYKLEVTGAIYGSSMVLGAALPVASGGTGATTAATARTNLGATTVGGNLFTLTDPSAITFPRFNADNTVSALDAATFRTAIGAGTGSGTVTSVDASGGTTGLSFTGGPITSSGTLTLGGTLAVANGGTGATTALNARVNLLPSYVGNATKVLAVNSGATDVEWITVGAGTVTSVAASGGTTGLTFSGSPITTSGTITLAGTLAVANGGTGATTAATARTNLGATTVGDNLFTLTNPSAITFPRFNADNTVSALDAATFRTAIGAGTSSTTGTVTSVSGTGTVSGLTLTGTVTTSGSLTLGGTLSVTPSNFASQTANTFLAAPNGVAGVPTFRAIVAADVPTLNQNTTGTAGNVTGTVAIANGGTGATTAATARTNLGATTVGGNLFTLTNPSAITFPRFNADNTVSALDAATFRTAIGAGTSSTTGTVTSVALSGGTTGLTVSGSPITTSGTITLAGTLAVANGGTGATTAATARTNLGATTVGGNLFTLTNPSAITFPRFNADNTVSALDAATFRTAIGAGTGSGTVTSVAASGGTTGLTFSGSPITTSGTLTLGGTLAVANGGTGATSLTSGYLVKGNGTSAVSASVVYDNGTNVGIGQSNPTTKLWVGSSGAGAGTATPDAISLGNTFANSAGDPAKTKLRLFQDNSPVYYGFGISANLMETHVPSGAAMAWYVAGGEKFRITSTGGITSSDLADAVGYKGLPQNSQTAAYTLALSDMGKHISITTGGITVPPNSGVGSVAFPVGATIVIFNNSASSQNIAITTDTMYLAGTATTGTRTLAQRGLATVVKVASTTWVISGSGVT